MKVGNLDGTPLTPAEDAANEIDLIFFSRRSCEVLWKVQGTLPAETQFDLHDKVEGIIQAVIEAERERCAKIAKMHENYVRDYSRDVFARAIADKIISGAPPSEQELRFGESVGWEPKK